jgi:hypothetical protein
VGSRSLVPIEGLLDHGIKQAENADMNDAIAIHAHPMLRCSTDAEFAVFVPKPELDLHP